MGSGGEPINWAMMRALSRSVANTVVFPLQDVLDLSSEHRMNLPGQPTGNWEWRFSWSQLQPERTQALAKMSAENGRYMSD